MEETREVVVPAYRKAELTAVLCDVCGYKLERPRTSFAGGVNWAGEWYDVEQTTVRIESGTDFPEGRMTTSTTLHICPPCFKSHILPLAKRSAPTVKDHG